MHGARAEAHEGLDAGGVESVAGAVVLVVDLVGFRSIPAGSGCPQMAGGRRISGGVGEVLSRCIH
jgi:hypothetical protein